MTWSPVLATKKRDGTHLYSCPRCADNQKFEINAKEGRMQCESCKFVGATKSFLYAAEN